MQYYTAPPGATNPEHKRVRFCLDNHIFLMISASRWQIPFTNYAVDNGAWTDYTNGLEFNHSRFTDYLKKVDTLPRKPEFVILPDIFDGGRKSYEMSVSYLYLADKYNVYLPIHKGMDLKDIEPDVIDRISGVFVGGGDSHRKRSLHDIVLFAHKHDKKCHVGRVGTLENFKLCYQNDVDSADSSTLMRNNRYTDILKYIRICERMKKEQTCLGVCWDD